jgi:hypothetical protein
MVIAAAVLAASLNASVAVEIDLSKLFHRAAKTQVQGLTCGITTVGYRFVGRPGQKFRYAGDVYEIPSEGSIELVADGGPDTYRMSGRTLPLNVWPLDQFGFREVPLAKE